MTKNKQDRIAALYPHVNEQDTPLPRSWNNQDKFNYIGLSQNNLRAQYKGVGKTHKDAASVRATNAIPAACGLYYFEIKVVSKGRDGYIGMGLCAQGVNTNKLPGWEKESYGYHADDGHSFCASAVGEIYGPTFTTGDVVGCGLNLIDKTCFYTKNGVNLGIAFRDLIPNLYPTIGLQTPGEIVDVNFGQQDFVFDIQEMKKELHARTMKTIEDFPVATDDGTWHGTLQRIVSAYLVHHGYCTTADMFAKSTGQSIAEELSSIRNRQRIQKLIMAGRISEAIDTTQSLYPGLLDQNPDLFFKLKCRQFIEMVNGHDGEVKIYAHSPSRSVRNSPCGSPSRLSSNASSSSAMKNGDNVNMCDTIEQTNGSRDDDTRVLSEHNHVSNGGEPMDINDETTPSTSSASHSSSAVSVITNSSKVVDPGPSIRQLCGGNMYAIEKLLAFGKTLQNLHREINNASKHAEQNETLMKEAFSLLAYNNPRESPVAYLLEADQREAICSTLNSAILEAHKLSGQPALELSIAQIENCLKMMAKSGLGACAMVDSKSFYQDEKFS